MELPEPYYWSVHDKWPALRSKKWFYLWVSCSKEIFMAIPTQYHVSTGISTVGKTEQEIKEAMFNIFTFMDKENPMT